MRATGREDPIAGVCALLAREGLRGAVSRAGQDGEIAVVRADPSLRRDLAQLAPEIRALGFRYVAIELDPID